MGKTTRPFRYDLNQIPYDYTVEVRNRFVGLELIDRVPDELWMEVHDIVQETGSKTISKKKKCKKAKTNRPFRYDLNKIPYDYLVEVTNRFKRFDLIDRVTEEL